MPGARDQVHRAFEAQGEMIRDRDPLDELDPRARALVLDILGIFVADALAATSDVDLSDRHGARRRPHPRDDVAVAEPRPGRADAWHAG